jgi:hypothetical protein
MDESGSKNNGPVLEDVERHYLPGTGPQEPLPFSIRVRRLHPWWPGSERHGRLVDTFIAALVLSPAAVWIGISYGWLPVLFVLAEIVIIWATIYRVMTGTILD